MIINGIVTMYKRLSYALKLMFSGYFIGALLLAVTFSTITVNIERWQFAVASPHSIILMFTIVMPLITVVLTANAFAEEFEAMTLPLTWSYPTMKVLLLLERLAVVLIFIAVYIAASLWAIDIWLVPLTWQGIWMIMKAAIPVHLFLLGLTLLFSLIGRNMLIGLAGGIAYWFIEMLTRGIWTKQLYLFQWVWPLESYSLEAQAWWLLSVAALFIIACAVMFVFGRNWIAKSR